MGILSHSILYRQYSIDTHPPYSLRLIDGGRAVSWLPACPYRQGSSVARDGRKRELMHMGMARRMSLLGVTVRHGWAGMVALTPYPASNPVGGSCMYIDPPYKWDAKNGSCFSVINIYIPTCVVVSSTRGRACEMISVRPRFC